MSPADEVDLDRTDSTIIFLQASNLLAKFVGNASGIHVPQNQKILFDAWTESYDPDFDQYNKTNLKFAFYCRRLCESWPTVLVDQTYTNWPVFDTSTCTASDNAAKGCFTSGSKGPSTSYMYFPYIGGINLFFSATKWHCSKRPVATNHELTRLHWWQHNNRHQLHGPGSLVLINGGVIKSERHPYIIQRIVLLCITRI